MPKFLERKLQAEAAAHGIQNVGAYVYGTLNKLGAMHGNKETAKGRAMDAKHAKDVKAGGRRHRLAGSHEGLYVTEHHRGAKKR